ncbi:MAG: dehydrogenase [Geobacteraceae bacterium GWC2_53_11]|nr:MAG: dehydrogenase [Geobacteraceae bacterium GWC2_53_11]
MTDLELYEEMVRLTRSGTPYVVATVVANSGSSPRKAGAKMLVRSDGSSVGTVGGGRVESETIVASLQALSTCEPRTLEFVLTEEYGFACGGRMSVFVEPQGSRSLLVMFGAGHVGRAVTRFAHDCGFRVVVVDERPECAVDQLLPGADEIHCCPVTDAFERLKLEPEHSVIIATTGHLHDFAAVRGSLATAAGFIGLLGSRRKKEALMLTLTEEDYAADQRERVISPVGLDIGAQTPEEIAVSIVAQLIQRRRQP